MTNDTISNTLKLIKKAYKHTVNKKLFKNIRFEKEKDGSFMLFSDSDIVIKQKISDKLLNENCLIDIKDFEQGIKLFNKEKISNISSKGNKILIESMSGERLECKGKKRIFL